MDVPTAPPKTDLAQFPGDQPPPYSECYTNPPPVVIQPQETGSAIYPLNNPQPNIPPFQQPGYPQPYPQLGQQPYLGPGQLPCPPSLQQLITQQPGAGEWMPLLQGYQSSSSCPPGLEFLTAIDQLLVHQEIDVFETMTGIIAPNKYNVKNSMGQKVFHVSEISDTSSRGTWGSSRPFGMQISNSIGQEVIHLDRPLACTPCCYPCCLQSMQVSAPPGNLIGIVKQDWSIWIPKFSIQDANGRTVLIIRGPVCTDSCSQGDVKYNVYLRDGKTKVGKIIRQWSGEIQEVFTSADNFVINFTTILNEKIKATLLGACILIDFMYYEVPPRRRRR